MSNRRKTSAERRANAKPTCRRCGCTGTLMGKTFGDLTRAVVCTICGAEQ